MYSNNWKLSVGDPTFLGWFTTILYFVSFILCIIILKKLKKDSNDGHSKKKLFWIMVLFTVSLLGINKQLDLQTLFLQSLRKIAMIQGWYSERRELQGFLVIVIAILVILFLVSLSKYLKEHWRECGFVFIGVIMLMIFVIIRTASINHVIYKTVRLPDIIYKWILESGGIILIISGELRNILEYRKKIVSKFKFDWEE